MEERMIWYYIRNSGDLEREAWYRDRVRPVKDPRGEAWRRSTFKEDGGYRDGFNPPRSSTGPGVKIWDLPTELIGQCVVGFLGLEDNQRLRTVSRLFRDSIPDRLEVLKELHKSTGEARLTAGEELSLKIPDMLSMVKSFLDGLAVPITLGVDGLECRDSEDGRKEWASEIWLGDEAGAPQLKMKLVVCSCYLYPKLRIHDGLWGKGSPSFWTSYPLIKWAMMSTLSLWNGDGMGWPEHTSNEADLAYVAFMNPEWDRLWDRVNTSS